MKTRSLALTLLLISLSLAGCASDTNGPTVTPTPATMTPTSATPTTSPTSILDPPALPVIGLAFSEDFETATPGGLPEGWTVVHGNWSVVANDSAPSGSHVVLSDTTELPETWILADAAGDWGDMNANVMFNVHSGERGQAGGIIFRYADEGNYYVVRYNHNELSWNLFRTIEGKRQKFAGTDEGAEAFQGGLDTWTPLKVVAKGASIQVFSGDTLVIDHTEDAPGAPTAGKIGIWTRWDSKTEFDDFSVAAN